MTAKASLISAWPTAEINVYSPLGRRIGKIEQLLIEPLSGRVKYAMVIFDLENLDTDVLPVPWRALHYNVALGGFHTCITEDQLAAAPRFEESAAQTQEWELKLKSFYNVH